MKNVAPATRGAVARCVSMFERGVVGFLVVLMMLVVALATLDLAWLLVVDIVTPPILLLDVDELLHLFGFFLLILIGIELLDTTKTYFNHGAVHVEIVLEVALIALARKVIVLDKASATSLLAFSALLAALAFATVLLRWSRSPARADRGNRGGEVD